MSIQKNFVVATWDVQFSTKLIILENNFIVNSSLLNVIGGSIAFLGNGLQKDLFEGSVINL